MLIRIPCFGGTWRRVKTNARLSTWDFLPGGHGTPDLDSATNCLLGALLRTGDRCTLTGSIESEEVHAALFTVVLQTINSNSEVFA